MMLDSSLSTFSGTSPFHLFPPSSDTLCRLGFPNMSRGLLKGQGRHYFFKTFACTVALASVLCPWFERVY